MHVLIKGKTGITHYALAPLRRIGTSIARIATLQFDNVQTFALRHLQHGVQGCSTTSLVVRDRGIQRHDLGTAACINATGLCVGMEVREVGADDQQYLRATPQPVDQLGHQCRRYIAHHQRQQLELPQDSLQERHMHLQAVLGGVHIRTGHDKRQVGDGQCAQGIHRHAP